VASVELLHQGESFFRFALEMEGVSVGAQEAGKLPVNYAGFFDKNNNNAGPVDFTAAATSSAPAVVHIKTRTKQRQVSNNLPKQRNPFSDFLVILTRSRIFLAGRE